MLCACRPNCPAVIFNNVQQQGIIGGRRILINEKKNASRLELARLKYLKLVGRDYLTLQ